MVKNSPANADVRHVVLIPEYGRFPGGGMQPTLVFLPGESHGQRSLEGYTVHRVAELDMNEST